MRIGVLGAGQLGRMLALAGYRLGLDLRFLDPAPDPSAGRVARHVAGRFDDQAALDRLADGVDVVTYEFENVPAAAAAYLSGRVPIRPTPRALEVAQDRLIEKQEFRRLGLNTVRFVAVDTLDELRAAVAELGLPAVLKTRRLGYDGRGQVVIRPGDDLAAAWAAVGDTRCLLEAFVEFDRELSILAVRGLDGELAFYPLVENDHRDGILRYSYAPAPRVSAQLQQTAEAYARTLLESLDYVGTGAIELFERDGELLLNEFAPRVHNSGHWTIEGAETSQFENHLRAIVGWPLGATTPVGHSAMVNLIGTIPDRAAVLRVPNAHLHLYDKSPAPRRKLGHITVRADSPDGVARSLELLREVVEF